MKRSSWILYLFENDKKSELFKIMEFRSVKEISYVLDMKREIISNWFHGLILPRGILNNCMLFQSIPSII